VGSWEDSIGYVHGFERDASGNFTEIAPSGAFQSVVPSAINNDGAITGYYVNDAFGQFGFVVPGTVEGQCSRTLSCSLLTTAARKP
jgi:hypothetical protein